MTPLAAPGPDLRAPAHVARADDEIRGRADGAGHHRTVPARAPSWPPTPSRSSRRTGWTRRARAADAGELQPRHPGHRARRVLSARRADRPVPDGLGPAYRLDLFDDEIETIRSFDVDTQRSLYPVGEVRLLPGREFPMDESPQSLPRALSRGVRRRSLARPALDIGNGIPSPASNTTCRCSSTRPRRCSTIWPMTRSPSPWATSTMPCSASARIRPAGTAFSRATASARCCRRRRCSWTLKRCTAS